jgi:hypothetical protein
MVSTAAACERERRGDMAEDVLVPIFGIIGVFGSTGFIAYVILEMYRSRQRTRLMSEFHQKLLDRITSAQDLGVLMNSAGGDRLLASLSGSAGAGPHSRILRAVQSGLVLLTLGVGLFIIAWAIYPTGRNELNVSAAISASLGAGLLLSAAAAYALSQRMGLMNGEDSRRIAPAHSA